MVEHRILDCLLLFTFVIAPRMTNRFFLDSDRGYALLHLLALAVVVASAFLGSGVGACVWCAFCVAGGVLFLHRARRAVLTLGGLAACVPFAFSVVSSVWFVAGTNELHLLGYDRSWSFYAALHGSVLGWLFVGCIAHLAKRAGAPRVYPVGCLLSFVLFLFVAFGIDGVPFIKRVGVVGFALLVPGLIALHALGVRARGAAPSWWSATSLAGIVVSMTMALANEFWGAFPRVLAGLPTMVLTHGVLNAVIVVPAFYFALLADRTSD